MISDQLDNALDEMRRRMAKGKTSTTAPVPGRHELQNEPMKLLLNTTAKALDGMLPAGTIFGLFLSRPGEIFYISNGDRGDMIRMVREWLAKQETTIDYEEGK